MTEEAIENEQSLLTDSWEFFVAAAELHVAMTSKDTERGRLFGPTYYLIGHSLELVMKSVLAAKGAEISYLKNMRPHRGNGIGHDLSKAAKDVIKLKCGGFTDAVEADFDSIEKLNIAYSSKRFEYRRRGWITAPDQRQFLDFLNNLIVLAKPIVQQRYAERIGLFQYSGICGGYVYGIERRD
jgi:hypothetical protein